AEEDEGSEGGLRKGPRPRAGFERSERLEAADRQHQVMNARWVTSPFSPQRGKKVPEGRMRGSVAAICALVLAIIGSGHEAKTPAASAKPSNDIILLTIDT